jgi:hypothetical protein
VGDGKTDPPLVEAQICVKGDKTYFKDGNDFRVVIEWVLGEGKDLSLDRHGVESIYVPITGGKFDTSKFEGKLPNDFAKEKFKEYNYQYFARFRKDTAWLWKGSGDFKVDASKSKLTADQGCIDFTRPSVLKGEDAKENLELGKTYTMALSWAVSPADSNE